MINVLAFSILGYLLGSIPFGIFIGKISKGLDIRDYGSGNTGMTNVLRTVGLKSAFAVLILDMSKSILSILITRVLTNSNSPELEVMAGLASIVGHNWPIFAGFRGGKGIATGWSGLFPLSWIAGLSATLVGIPIALVSGYMSLGSILGAAAGCITLIVLAIASSLPDVYAWYGIVGGIIVISKHRDNISRLINRSESRLHFQEYFKRFK